jgi:hypothetical protein
VIVLDTGVLYALADPSDTHHHSCTRWLRSTPDELIVPTLVITEAAYLIGSRGGQPWKRSSSTRSTPAADSR